jgi:hypothetical protein
MNDLIAGIYAVEQIVERIEERLNEARNL